MSSKIGCRLRQVRESDKVSIEVMSDKMGVNKNTLGAYERGERLPDIDFLIAFSAKTGEDFLALLELRLKDSPSPGASTAVAIMDSIAGALEAKNGRIAPIRLKIEEARAPYTVSPAAELFDQQSAWAEAIIRVALSVRNKPQFAKSPDDLHQRMALLVYRSVFFFCDGDLLKVNQWLADADKINSLVHLVYETDCMKQGIAPVTDLNSDS